MRKLKLKYEFHLCMHIFLQSACQTTCAIHFFFAIHLTHHKKNSVKVEFQQNIQHPKLSFYYILIPYQTYYRLMHGCQTEPTGQKWPVRCNGCLQKCEISKEDEGSFFFYCLLTEKHITDSLAVATWLTEPAWFNSIQFHGCVLVLCRACAQLCRLSSRCLPQLACNNQPVCGPLLLLLLLLQLKRRPEL